MGLKMRSLRSLLQVLQRFCGTLGVLVEALVETFPEPVLLELVTFFAYE